MEESSTYQAILKKGTEIGLTQGERQLLLRLGTQRFGTPTRKEKREIEQITSITQMEQLADRLLQVSSWAELLGGN